MSNVISDLLEIYWFICQNISISYKILIKYLQNNCDIYQFHLTSNHPKYILYTIIDPFMDFSLLHSNTLYTCDNNFSQGASCLGGCSCQMTKLVAVTQILYTLVSHWFSHISEALSTVLFI